MPAAIGRAAGLTRRETLVAATGALAAALPGFAVAAPDSGEVERHGLSAFGDLKYPADFRNFEYVDPQARKGGTFSQVGAVRYYNQNFLTFDSLNGFILRGDAALGIERTFATLMKRAWDEPDAVYGLAARAVRVSADGRVYRFLLRPQARFHDGTPLTAHDVAFSLNLLKAKGHQQIRQQLQEFDGAEAADDATLVARFAENRPRDTPLYVAEWLPIFSRAYYSAHSFEESTLDVPLGSGAYKVGRFDAGRYIEYQRVTDWWGAELPVSRGQNNFDVLRYEFYRDREAGFQAFTARNYLFREEFTARVWATRYDFPAVRDGRVKREELPDQRPAGAQGWFFNTRRDKFKDRRLRDALNYAFDFEWVNKNLMYGAYKRTRSIFENSDMMAVGKPGPDELALLEPFRGKVPDEVFGDPFLPPVSDGSGQDRALLRTATRIVHEAGYTVKDHKLVDPRGEPVTIEFLIDDPTFEPHHAALVKNLAILGIDATVRLVDAVQFRARADDYDFDVTVERLAFESTPGDSLRVFLSSRAAAEKGSQNLAGIADPVVDTLIDKVIAAPDRGALSTACRALDRVVRSGRYWIPQWYNDKHRLAYWDVFDRPPPATYPRYDRGDRAIPETWWYDPGRAAKTERPG
ncbi:MAG TPA: extracellular solute-binding protein [Xanthobacteraceae bacterium]|nr:extracellular solute-binding protein [Xanthobacteraceae bacterium]